MPEIKNFPNNQDEYRGAEAVMHWLYGRTSGVFGAAGNAGVAAFQPPRMAVQVSDGTGWLADENGLGCVWWIDNNASGGSPLALAIDAADAVYNRIDRVIVEWNTPNYTDWPVVRVLKGTFATKAVAPALTNDSTTRQISLAKISIKAGATEISAADITDERLDAAVCGLVTDRVNVDTKTINAQVMALVNELRTKLSEVEAQTYYASKEYVDTAKSAANTYTDASVRKAAPRNLLDNSDFRNPVNQRGQASYTSYGYGIDRWTSSHDFSVNVSDGCITLTGTETFHHLMQGIEKFKTIVGKTVTLVIRCKGVSGSSIKLAIIGGSDLIGNSEFISLTGEWQTIVQTITIPADYSEADMWFSIYPHSGGSSGTELSIEWAALYEGEYTAATLPEYHPKGYGAELAECKRYYQKFFSVGNFGFAKTYVCGFPFEVEFRTVPTVNVTSLIDMPEWVERNVTRVIANAKGVQYIYSDNCKSVAHLVEGYATADL